MNRRTRLVAVLLSLPIGVLLFEAAVRVFHVRWDINPVWRYHSVLGWSQVPGGRFMQPVPTGKHEVAFNALGFRDEEHALEKPPGVRRIVVIGDSFSEALQVEFEDAFYRRLARLLPQKVEVINLGVGDFGNAQELIALERYGFAYSPDLVVQQIFPLNDICNDSIELYRLCKSDNDRYRPYFVEEGDTLRLTTAQPMRNWMRRRLATYGVLEHAWLKLTHATLDEAGWERHIARAGMGPLVPVLQTYVPEGSQHEIISRAWRVAEKILARTVESCRARGVAYIPVVTPFEATFGTMWDEFSRSLPAGHKVDPGYPDRRLAALFERLGTPAVLLRDAFTREESKVRPYIDGHLNSEGHRVVAESLAREIVARGLLQR